MSTMTRLEALRIAESAITASMLTTDAAIVLATARAERVNGNDTSDALHEQKRVLARAVNVIDDIRDGLTCTCSATAFPSATPHERGSAGCVDEAGGDEPFNGKRVVTVLRIGERIEAYADSADARAAERAYLAQGIETQQMNVVEVISGFDYAGAAQRSAEAEGDL